MSKRTGSSRHAGKIWRNCGAFAPYFFGYGADVARLLRIFLACLCPKPNGELGCCSLPANDGLLMIDIPQFTYG